VSLLDRRAFLATLGLGTAAVAARIALLPRGLSDEEIERLANVGDDEAGDANVDLSGSMAFNPVAAEFELGPPILKYRPTFNINTVERFSHPPLADPNDWSVSVDGLVQDSMLLTPDRIAALPRFEFVSDFHCVEGWGVRNVRWEGVQLAPLLEQAGPRRGARFVTFHALGCVYTDSLTLEQARRPEVLLATHLNGEPLPDRQGFPIRLVVPFMYGYKSVKWVNRVTLESKRHVGFWERRGWQLDPYT
jgi:DMSO/TMAO reductase YedYZ molybdopterin-dependent catalytic subunit